MDKLKMHTPNKADENFKKLAELFPNAVTETIDENGEVVRAIDKDVLMQEISLHSSGWQRGTLPVHLAGQEEVRSSCQCTNQQNPPPLPGGKCGL